jgi:hypothetical protein
MVYIGFSLPTFIFQVESKYYAKGKINNILYRVFINYITLLNLLHGKNANSVLILTFQQFFLLFLVLPFVSLIFSWCLCN